MHEGKNWKISIFACLTSQSTPFDDTEKKKKHVEC